MGKNKGIISIIISITLVVVIIGIILVSKNQISDQPQVVNNSPSLTNPISQDLSTFQSKTLKFSVSIPGDFQTKDDIVAVKLSNKEGVILITRPGTNFDNLSDFLNDVIRTNNYSISEKTELTIDNMPAISVKLNNAKKVYLIYKENFVYNLTTESQALYSDLDQIARSFRYTP